MRKGFIRRALSLACVLSFTVASLPMATFAGTKITVKAQTFTNKAETTANVSDFTEADLLTDVAQPNTQSNIYSGTPSTGYYLETMQGNNYLIGFYVGHFTGSGNFNNYTLSRVSDGVIFYDLDVTDYSRFSVTLAPSA